MQDAAFSAAQDALAEAHKLGYVVGDTKASNFLVR